MTSARPRHHEVREFEYELPKVQTRAAQHHRCGIDVDVRKTVNEDNGISHEIALRRSAHT